ncbi:MAG TPA: Pvc16 family protein [Rhodoblastus sp.]|nr:Pvc16 family protein [Rhodoblastus sp.]
MATYAAIPAVMTALRQMLVESLPSELAGGDAPVGGSIRLFGSEDFRQPPAGDYLALWLYRIESEAGLFAGTRHVLPGTVSAPELPLNLHFLMIAVAASAFTEASLMGWGLQQMARQPVIAAERLAAQIPSSPRFNPNGADDVHIVPENLSLDELARLWELPPAKYALSAPFVAQGLRLTLEPDGQV